MSKHKSEVLTVQIKLKVKFPQEVITKIKTLPPVFPKSFRTALWLKTGDGCFWHDECKTINLRNRKIALTVFTEMHTLHLSSWILKCYYSQRNLMGTNRENIVPGNLCIMKANVRYRQKAIFSIKKYLPLQSMISSCSKNLKHPW